MALRPLAGVLIFLAILLPVAAAGAEVIVHPGYPENAIARSLLRGVFGMRVRAWPDGTPVHVFVLPDDDPLHDEFSKSVLQMYPYQLRQNWERLLYSGTGQQPITVTSEAELLQRVAGTRGAIGYAAAPPRGPASATVKVLHVR